MGAQGVDGHAARSRVQRAPSVFLPCFGSSDAETARGGSEAVSRFSFACYALFRVRSLGRSLCGQLVPLVLSTADQDCLLWSVGGHARCVVASGRGVLRRGRRWKRNGRVRTRPRASRAKQKKKGKKIEEERKGARIARCLFLRFCVVRSRHGGVAFRGSLPSALVAGSLAIDVGRGQGTEGWWPLVGRGGLQGRCHRDGRCMRDAAVVDVFPRSLGGREEGWSEQGAGEREQIRRAAGMGGGLISRAVCQRADHQLFDASASLVVVFFLLPALFTIFLIRFELLAAQVVLDSAGTGLPRAVSAPKPLHLGTCTSG